MVLLCRCGWPPGLLFVLWWMYEGSAEWVMVLKNRIFFFFKDEELLWRLG